MNLPFKALKLDSLWKADAAVPGERLVKLQVEVSGFHKATFPKREIIHYDFPAREDMPPVRINWYNGGGHAPAPRRLMEKLMGRRLDWGDAGEKRWQDHAGCLIVGTKGMIHSTGHNMSFRLLPEEKFKDFQEPPRSLPRSRGHEREWLDACKGGKPAMSNFDYSGPLTQFVLLGNVATQFSRRLDFDPVAMKIVNFAQANEALSREYRQGKPTDCKNPPKLWYHILNRGAPAIKTPISHCGLAPADRHETDPSGVYQRIPGRGRIRIPHLGTAAPSRPGQKEGPVHSVDPGVRAAGTGGTAVRANRRSLRAVRELPLLSPSMRCQPAGRGEGILPSSRSGHGLQRLLRGRLVRQQGPWWDPERPDNEDGE